jgi:hypothetical protein
MWGRLNVKSGMNHFSHRQTGNFQDFIIPFSSSLGTSAFKILFFSAYFSKHKLN